MTQPKGMEVYRELQSKTSGLASLATMIATRHARPAAKLRGLLKLVEAGHVCDNAGFAIDRLIVDGFPVDLQILEKAHVITLVETALRDDHSPRDKESSNVVGPASTQPTIPACTDRTKILRRLSISPTVRVHGSRSCEEHKLLSSMPPLIPSANLPHQRKRHGRQQSR